MRICPPTRSLITLKRSQAIAREFDGKAGLYESDRLASWYQAHNDHILERLHLKAGDVVLDIGCGTGYLLRRIVERHPNVHGIGVDLSSAMIETAKAKAEGLEGLQWIQVDWSHPEAELEAMLKAQPIRHAVIASALHYLEDPEKDLRYLHRWLIPGGIAWILERDRGSSPLTLLWDWAHRVLVRDYVRFFSCDELIMILKRAGFAKVSQDSQLRKMLWKGKLNTSLVLLSGRKES